MRRGDKVEFIDTKDGILLVPVIPFENLYGVDKHRKNLIYRMVREIHSERREVSAD